MPDTSVQLSDDIFAELRKIDTPTTPAIHGDWLFPATP